MGTETPWDGKTELYELPEIDEELKPYVSNYRFNLYDYHGHKDFSVFKTENRYLFEILSRSEDKETGSGPVIFHFRIKTTLPPKENARLW